MLMCNLVYGQWNTTGLNNGSGASFGTNNNFPINIYTFGTLRARFTTGNALSSLVGNSGDGLRIIDPMAGGAGHLDLFTSNLNGGNETHVVWGGSGQVSGQNLRFEFLAKAAQGFWFNLLNPSNQYYKFATNATVHAFVGSNRFWRIGDQTEMANNSAVRRLEVVQDDWQFRLSRTNGVFTDFQTNANGNLQIKPQGEKVGINATANPTATLDVFGDARIRNVVAATPNSILVGVNASGASDVNIRRLDFNGNSNTFLGGDGTFHTVNTTPPPANNGVSRNLLSANAPYQLGDLYINPIIVTNTNSQLTNDRQVRLNNRNLIFSGPGRVAIGLVWPNLPTEMFDVNGNARFRNVPVQGGQSLILGLQNGTGTNDVELSRLEFPNNNTVALLGDGTWGSIGGSITGANNGASKSSSNPALIVFGQDYLQTGDPAQLLNNRQLPLRGFNILFTDNGRIGLGSSFTTSGINPLAKMDIRPTPTDAWGIYVQNQNNMSSFPDYQMNRLHNDATGTQINTSLYIETKGNPVKMAVGINTKALSVSAPVNLGIDGWAAGATQTNVGGRFNASGSAVENTGVEGYANSANINKGAIFRGGNPFDVTSSQNIGCYTEAFGGNSAIGIYATASGGAATSLAGLFNGNAEAINGTFISDQQFKTNVVRIEGGLKTLMQLKPVKYSFDVSGYPQFNFGSELQYGFIAQDVEVILPSLVHQSGLPAQYDSLGNVVVPATPYKSLNYNAIIPINTEAIIELNKKVEMATLSDQTIKTNIQELTGSLEMVLDMRGVSYDWNHTVHPELNLDSTNHVGFIAQEIAQIDPRLTYLADDSLLHVEYDKVVPILAEAIQELNGQVTSKDSIINVLITENSVQQNTIDDLNNRLTQLENCLSGILPYLCQLSHSAIQANTPETQEEVRKNLNVTLSNRNAIVLDQNVPNPFAEQTIINFSIPETVKKAQIHFYDGNGRFMNSVEVIERGLGSITVFGSDLSTGVYTYTLVADGQVVATKKMMKQ